jgi:Arc/MetJ-type ribon-helix-helix transcriptional regulator
MRNIINISLPKEMAHRVKKEVKRGKFASTSEYFRHLLRTQEFEEEMNSRRKDFEAGKFTRLRSLKDLR